MKFVLISGLLLAAFGWEIVLSQTISFDKDRGIVQYLTGENQHGERVNFDPPGERPLVLFLLPKADSRKEAELMMERVTHFFESLNEYRNESINGILVVQPVWSGPLVSRIFRSRLRDKPFSIIRDTNGEITGRVHDKPYTIMAWLVNEKGEILFKTTEPFSDTGNQFLREKIEGVSNEVNSINTRQK